MTNDFLKFEDILCVLPALIVFIASLVPITLKVLNSNREPNSSTVSLIAIVGLLAGAVSSLALNANIKNVYYAFSGALVFDGVAALSIVVVLVITALTVILSKEHLATRGAQFSEYIFLLLNSAVGMVILVSANDLIVMFIGIEMMSLCLYLLIALSNEGRLSKEASLKYFVLGSFASAIFLYGVAMLYGATGTTYINQLLEVSAGQIGMSYIYLFGVVFAVLGFAFKVAIVPFHAWTPDVYEGSPTPLTGYMATAVKLVTFVAFLRFLIGDYVALELSGKLLDVLQWLAVLTMTLGNIAAIMQSGLKRMLAYSSIAHSGYVLIGLIVVALGGSGWSGSTSVMFYIIAYSIMTLGAFAVCSTLEKNEMSLVQVDDLRGLSQRSPWTAAFFTIFMLSLAGIPPLIGFFGKFFIFSAALKQGLLWLVFWGAINSVISVYYYLRSIVLMYMKEGDGADVASQYKYSHVVIALSAILVVGLGIFTEPVYKAVIEAVNTLF